MEEVQNPPDRNHSSNGASILRPSDYDRDVARASDLLPCDSGVRFLPEVDQEDQSLHSLSMQSQSDLAILLDITTPVQWTNHCQTLSFLVSDFHFDTRLLNNQPYTATTISQENQFLYTQLVSSVLHYLTHLRDHQHLFQIFYRLLTIICQC